MANTNTDTTATKPHKPRSAAGASKALRDISDDNLILNERYKRLTDTQNKHTEDLTQLRLLMESFVTKFEGYINANKELKEEVTKLSTVVEDTNRLVTSSTDVEFKMDVDGIVHKMKLNDAIQLLVNKTNPTLRVNKFNLAVESWMKFIFYIIVTGFVVLMIFKTNLGNISQLNNNQSQGTTMGVPYMGNSTNNKN